MAPWAVGHDSNYASRANARQWAVKAVSKKFWGAEVTHWLMENSFKQIFRNWNVTEWAV